MRLILSPWADTFGEFARSIQNTAILVSPYITEQPLESLAFALSEKNTPQIRLLTNLSTDSIVKGSLNTRSIADFYRRFPKTIVRHLPGLHAKVYVADEHTAIVTSGNLTNNSLYQNYEYGIEISDSEVVRQIARDLLDYGDLGSRVSLDELDRLTEAFESLARKHTNALNSADASIRREFEDQLAFTDESLRNLRARPGESANSIFARTILYVLRKGPTATKEIHPVIQSIHPDLCDDHTDRIINGVHFGREWKHRVRGAQVDLQRKGLIELVDRKWRLVQEE